MTFSWRLVQCTIGTILKPTKDRNSICNQLVTSAILEIIERFKITFTANVKLYHGDSLVLDWDSCFTGITITISNKITNLVTHSLYPLIATIFHFILPTFLRRFSYLWFLFANTSNRGRDLLFLLFFLLSGKICCWSWFSSQMTFSWRLVQCSIRTILKPTKDRNSICIGDECNCGNNREV